MKQSPLNPLKNKMLCSSLAVLLAVTTGLTHNVAHAEPSAPVANSDVPYNVGPPTIIHRILNGNMDIELAFSRVRAAKIDVNAAHNNLIPGISFSPTAAATFGVDNIQFLLPFLVPGNWFKADQSENMLQAQGYSFYALELNTLASALSTYATYLGDVEIKKIFQDQLASLRKDTDILKVQYDIGLISEGIYKQALSQYESVHRDLKGLEAKIVSEEAALQKMMGFDFEQKMVFLNTGHITASPVEVDLVQQAGTQESDFDFRPIIRKALPELLAKIPESSQLKALKAAGHNAMQSAKFAFIGQGTIAVPTAENSHADSSAGLSLSFGAFLASLRQAASNNLQEVEIMQDQLEIAQSNVLMTLLPQILIYRHQVEIAIEAESGARTAFLEWQAKFEMGLVDYHTTVMTSFTNWTNAQIARVNAQIALDQTRLALSRTYISGNFKSVRGCELAAHSKAWHFSDIIGLDNSQVNASLSKLCRHFSDTTTPQ